jgi:hypothetical protein
MESNEIEFRNILTPVTCPRCQKKYATRLGVDFLSRHLGQAIQCVCCSCAVKQINEIKRRK